VAVGARVGPIEDAVQQRTVDQGLAARALVGTKGLGQRHEPCVVIAVDAAGFGQQPGLGGAGIAEVQQQRGCCRRIVVPECELPGMGDGLRMRVLWQVFQPALEVVSESVRSNMRCRIGALSSKRPSRPRASAKRSCRLSSY
jgi:hypothetical protein